MSGGCLWLLFGGATPVSRGLSRDQAPSADLHEARPLISAPEQIEVRAGNAVPPAEFLDAIRVPIAVHIFASRHQWTGRNLQRIELLILRKQISH
jgi:hypothetical protein